MHIVVSYLIGSIMLPRLISPYDFPQQELYRLKLLLRMLRLCRTSWRLIKPLLILLLGPQRHSLFALRQMETPSYQDRNVRLLAAPGYQ